MNQILKNILYEFLMIPVIFLGFPAVSVWLFISDTYLSNIYPPVFSVFFILSWFSVYAVIVGEKVRDQVKDKGLQVYLSKLRSKERLQSISRNGIEYSIRIGIGGLLTGFTILHISAYIDQGVGTLIIGIVLAFYIPIIDKKHDFTRLKQLSCMVKSKLI